MDRKSRTSYVEGADALDAALKRIGDRATGILLREAVQKGADIIADEAKRLAPKDTGALAAGIHAEITTSKQGQAVADVSFNKKQWYGGLVEKGTKNIPAHPYIRPAFDTKADEAEEAVARYLWDALEDVL
jgi:HK97 gp10 family phage protein